MLHSSVVANRLALLPTELRQELLKADRVRPVAFPTRSHSHPLSCGAAAYFTASFSQPWEYASRAFIE